MADNTTLTCAHVAAALDDLLDGRAEHPGRAALEAHVAGCPSCRALVADVRAIRVAARTLEPIEPPPAVWAAVRARVDSGRVAASPLSRFDRLVVWATGWGGVLQPAAAVAVLALLVSSLVWVGTRLGGAPPRLSAGQSGGSAPVEFAVAEAEYSDAIARLEEAAGGAPGGLDPVTNAALRATIDEIDSAIGEARDALARQPGDEWSQESLLDALGSKVALLQDTVALLGEFDERSEERNP